MKQDRGKHVNRWAGVGNTWLFVGILGGLLYLMINKEYQFAIALALSGIYSEMWNMRVSKHACEDPSVHQ